MSVAELEMAVGGGGPQVDRFKGASYRLRGRGIDSLPSIRPELVHRAGFCWAILVVTCGDAFVSALV